MKFTAGTIRKPVQILSAVGIVVALQTGHISIAILLIAGMAAGVIFGKVFCRWFCPMGLVMEAMMSMSPDQKAKSLYQYHKLGCPIAWISGLLNRLSIFSVGKNPKKECRECGVCDKACYIATLDISYSHFKKEAKNPANSYTCSRCMACVDSCPTGHLNYSVRKIKR